MTELPPDPIDLPDLQQSLSLISLISRSHHTSLIKLLGASLSGSYVYLVYEFVGGKNISQDILEQLTPMIILHFGGNILSRIGTLFDKYMDALLNAVPPAKTGKSANETSKDDNTKSGRPKKSKSASNADKSASVNGEVSVSNQRNQRLTPAELQRQKIASLQKKLLDELNEEGDGHAAPVVKLGDASMASPFTAKHASVAPTTDIIRQGRSTLVTTLQMFKILGLNCLATTYVLSVMYLDGVKLGDMQATISGVFTAAFFLFISHARPLQTLSSERPHPNIFCAYVFLSLLGQFAIHLLFLISSVNEAEKHMPEECIEPDSEFHPNLVNTVSYMVNMMLQVATFAVNYMGHPFNQSISENKPSFTVLSS
ncbi:hypothetical protein ACLB2K_027645 [Fragaria x ananassa]